jgi:hypothetical protein
VSADTEFVSKLDDRARIDLGDLGIGELLALSRRILAELRRRGVIRSGNAPAGDDVSSLMTQHRGRGGR